MLDLVVQRTHNTPPLFRIKLVFELISAQESVGCFCVFQLEYSSIMKEGLMVC